MRVWGQPSTRKHPYAQTPTSRHTYRECQGVVLNAAKKVSANPAGQSWRLTPRGRTPVLHRRSGPATHTGEGYKLAVDVGGGGGGQHRLRSRREQGGSLSSGDVGRQVVLGGWPLVGREGTGVLGCHCFQGA